MWCTPFALPCRAEALPGTFQYWNGLEKLFLDSVDFLPFPRHLGYVLHDMLGCLWSPMGSTFLPW